MRIRVLWFIWEKKRINYLKFKVEAEWETKLGKIGILFLRRFKERETLKCVSRVFIMYLTKCFLIWPNLAHYINHWAKVHSLYKFRGFYLIYDILTCFCICFTVLNEINNYLYWWIVISESEGKKDYKSLYKLCVICLLHINIQR